MERTHLNHLRSGDRLGDPRRDSHVHRAKPVVTATRKGVETLTPCTHSPVHRKMDDVVHPNDPDHVRVVHVEGVEGKVPGQCVMVPAIL